MGILGWIVQIVLSFSFIKMGYLKENSRIILFSSHYLLQELFNFFPPLNSNSFLGYFIEYHPLLQMNLHLELLLYFNNAMTLSIMINSFIIYFPLFMVFLYSYPTLKLPIIWFINNNSCLKFLEGNCWKIFSNCWMIHWIILKFMIKIYLIAYFID